MTERNPDSLDVGITRISTQSETFASLILGGILVAEPPLSLVVFVVLITLKIQKRIQTHQAHRDRYKDQHKYKQNAQFL